MRRLPIPNALTLVLVTLILVNYFGVFADLDWTWQVRTGQLIVDMGQLRTPETFSYTIAGTEVHDFEWLYEVILYFAWSVFGLGGLKFLKVLLVFTPLFLVGRQLQREGVRWHGIVLALGAAVFTLAPAWNLRPLYCTTIGLLLVATMLHNHCTGKQPLSWWLVAVMLVWSNLHPGVITGQGLILGAIGWEWLNQWLRWNTPLDPSLARRVCDPSLARRACVGSLWRLTLIGSVAFAATFLSPDPIERFRYPFKPELAHPIMRIFSEMQPLYTFLSKPPYAVAVIYLVAALVMLTIVFRFRHYRVWELALFAGLAFLGNFAFRSAMDWLLVMLALGTPQIARLLAQAARTMRARIGIAGMLRVDRSLKKTLASPLFRWQPAWISATLVALLAMSLFPPLSRAMPLQNSGEWPVAALNHIEESGIAGRFFAPPDYGAYVGWRLGARGKIYTDTRGFFFPPVLLEDSHFIPQLGPEWRQRLDRVLYQYQSDFLLLETQGPRGALWQLLEKHVPRPLYRDQQTVLLGADQVRDGLRAIDQTFRAASR
ncbi:MAG: hypothetical protein L0Y70_17235 [Gemmataceae bacterium]|nr:hypothetical protein [Gemmataceae bacterium]